MNPKWQFVFTSLLTLAPSALAQTTLYDLAGAGTGGLAPSVLAGSDANSDGVPDIAVLPSGLAHPGRIDLHSGADGSFIRSLVPPPSPPGVDRYLAGPIVALADVTGDAVGDWACLGITETGTGPIASLYVFNAVTGVLTFTSGVSGPGPSVRFVEAGDFDGNGQPDVAVGQPAADITTPTFVYVTQGVNGPLLGLESGLSPFESLGSALARAGDFDGDGREDLLVSTPNAFVGSGKFGIVKVLGYQPGSMTFRVLRTFASPTGDLSSFGVAVAGMGDLNADGVVDCAIASPAAHSVYAYSGATGAILWTFSAPSLAPSVLSPAGDVDSDGVQDLLVGAPNQARVDLVSGANGASLETVVGPPSFGASLAGQLDLDADGCLDFVVGAPSSALTRVISTDCGVAPPMTYCVSSLTTGGCTPSIGVAGRASISNATNCAVTTASVDGQRNGTTFYGVASASLPWAVGSTSTLCVAPPLQRSGLANSNGTAGACDGALAFDLNGYLAAHPTALGSPFTVGRKLFVQGWFRDNGAPKNSNLSNAVEVTLGP